MWWSCAALRQAGGIQAAATLVLVQDGAEGLEVYVQTRSATMAFAAGALVFPGGKVNAGDRADGVDAETAARRAAVRETFEESGYDVPVTALLPLAHWIAPEDILQRFDTRFYVAPVPQTRAGVLDLRESSAEQWLPPALLADYAQTGAARVLFPTWMTARRLARFASVAALLDHVRATPVVVMIPHQVQKADGAHLCLLPQGGYEAASIPLTQVWRG